MTSVVVTTFGEPELICLTLLALGRQSLKPDEVIVADDGSDESTLKAIETLSGKLTFDLIHVWQAKDGFRAARSRNNAIHVSRGDFLAFLDQDTIPHRDWLETYRRNVPGGHAGLGFILRLTAERSALVNRETILSGSFESFHDSSEARRVRRLQGKFRYYAFLRRMGIKVRNRPALGSGNFAAWRSDLVKVNGFDEEYVGWGQEDDDLGRRLYLSGVKPVPLVDSALVSHVAHPPRRPADWAQGTNAQRYSTDRKSVLCAKGLSAHPHPDVRVTRIR